MLLVVSPLFVSPRKTNLLHGMLLVVSPLSVSPRKTLSVSPCKTNLLQPIYGRSIFVIICRFTDTVMKAYKGVFHVLNVYVASFFDRSM
jgi:hypothetical protein